MYIHTYVIKNARVIHQLTLQLMSTAFAIHLLSEAVNAPELDGLMQPLLLCLALDQGLPCREPARVQVVVPPQALGR